MTIRFLTSWNGYSAGDRATLSGAVEALLVASGLARLDYVQDGTSPLSLPNVNESRATVAAAAQRRVRSNFWSPSGRYEVVANGADHTTAMQITLPPWYAIRFHVPNAVTSAIANCRLKFTPTATLSAAGASQELAPSDGAWGSAVVSGSAAFSLSAAPSAGKIAYTTTDWYIGKPSLRRAGAARDVLNFRLEIPAAAANRTAYNVAGLTGLLNEADNDIGFLWRPRTAAVLGVGTLGNMTIANSVVDYLCHPVIVEYIPAIPEPSVLGLGDSIRDGSGDANRLGYQIRAAAQVGGINYWSQAIGGSTMTDWLDRLRAVLAAGMRPTHCMVPNFSPNNAASGTLTQAQIDGMRGYYAVIMAELASYGIVAIPETGIPSTPGLSLGKDWGAGDALRRAWNDEQRALYGQDLVDTDAMLAGLSDADGQILIADGLTTDGLHQNTAGTPRMVTDAARVMQRIKSGLL
ncbi:SGNH/GDSL hydrolase family protein [Methyloversatilis discipulorum]|uniref:SGNH/GDSL hydrolase family protein n=1 Tax=Methyloversatilis discipulorum TaxID=1119528 RepID=UPI001A588CFB|nr:hypothetical protein [Methyloversatilis discipulorum]MBL8469646.1 hypothetical protein [Methyloversatilis discipulorum]